jgi:pimeloyl-ACP methyl ester carboxylesterase
MADPPAGANDFACKPTAAHPNPVILVHGLSATMGANWGYLSPLLKQRAYCVFALTYGLDPRASALGFPGGVIPIEQSAAELAAFADKVLAATGARKVDLVGHSEGTFMPQYWLKFLGGAAKVERYVAWTPLYDGTRLLGINDVEDLGAQFGLAQPLVDVVASLCGSCPQFVAGSEMQRKLAEGGAAAPGVKYTTVMSRYDELVIPYTSGVLDAPATNHVLQDVCPSDLSEHALVANDPVAAQLTFNALDPANARPVDCEKLPAYAGGPAGATAGPDPIATALRSRIERFRVRRLTLTAVPAGARVRLAACSGQARGARRCAVATRRYAVSGARRAMRLAGAFDGRRLRPGTVIRVTVTKAGMRGKAFAVRVRKDGRGKATSALLPG